MVESSVKNKICPHCGADVRSGSLFCYSCGKSVAPEIQSADNGKTAPLEKSLRETAEPAKRNVTAIEEKPFAKPLEPLAKPAASEIPKSSIENDGKLKSAAAMRRKSKVTTQKTIEYVWEETPRAPNLLFLAAAFVLTIFAALILLAMLYLR